MSEHVNRISNQKAAALYTVHSVLEQLQGFSSMALRMAEKTDLAGKSTFSAIEAEVTLQFYEANLKKLDLAKALREFIEACDQEGVK